MRPRLDAACCVHCCRRVLRHACVTCLRAYTPCHARPSPAPLLTHTPTLRSVQRSPNWAVIPEAERLGTAGHGLPAGAAAAGVWLAGAAGAAGMATGATAAGATSVASAPSPTATPLTQRPAAPLPAAVEAEDEF